MHPLAKRISNPAHPRFTANSSTQHELLQLKNRILSAGPALLFDLRDDALQNNGAALSTGAPNRLLSRPVERHRIVRVHRNARNPARLCNRVDIRGLTLLTA